MAEPRYLRMLKELGPELRRQLVCGLHVHVGMESFEACLRTLAAIVPVAAGRPRSLAQLAVRPGCGDRRALVSRGPAGRAAARRTAAGLRIAGGLGDLHRGDRRGLHAQLVGRSPAPAPRHDRGADSRPADGCRPLGGARRLDSGALRRRSGTGRRRTGLVSRAAGGGCGAERLGRRSCSRWSSRQRESSAPGTSSRSCASRRRRSVSSRRVVAKGSRRSWPSSWRGPRHDPAPLGALPAPAGLGAAGQLERAGRPRRPRHRGGRRGRRRRPCRRCRRPGSCSRAGGRADPGRIAVGAGGLVRRSRPERRAAAGSRPPRPRRARSTRSPAMRARSSSSAKARSGAPSPGSEASKGSGLR